MEIDAPPSDFDALATACAPFVDEHLAGVLAASDPIPNLHDAALYSLGLDGLAASRGKRIRPVLCLVVAQALDADVRRALPFASAIELMHNFALVHDDIQDGDEVRRNRPSTHVRHGVPHGINIGDHLLCKVWTTLLDEREDLDPALRLGLMRLMARTLEHTIAGQALDMNARARRDFRVADYMRLVREKTGHYLAAPMLGGAMVAGAPQGVLDALEHFGHAMGPLFQIIDDLLDLTPGKGRGGLVGNDVREGKRSFLVAVATEQASPGDRERLLDILDLPRAQTSEAHVQEAVAIFERSGALQAAPAACNALMAEGLEALRGTPPRLARVLSDFAERMAAREA